jgi:PAS domain S-box-containing protein
MIISRNEEGKPLRMIGTHTDITDKMLAEDRIRESENQYKALFHSNPLPCWIYDVHTLRMLEVNEAAVSLYGYSKEEFLSQTVLMLQQEEKKQYVKEKVRVEKSTPSIEENNWCHLKKNGETTFVDLKINSIFYQNREAKLVVAQDVTAKTLMERELRQSYERFDIMMRATHDLIWDWNLETNIVYRDELGLKKVYGLSSNELIKGIYQWLGRIHPEDQNRVEDIINDILRSSEQDTFDIEYRFRRDDNSYSFVYDRGMIIRNEAGTPVRMIGAAQDVTERKRLEQELLQNELERQKAINQATVDTQEQERSEIGKELHDNVNQVLTTTKLYLDLALTNMELKDELIQKSNRNIVSVINEIRQLSRSLMDPSIGDLGLIDSIHDLIENIHLTRKLNVSLTADKKIENLMDKNQKLTVFRIIQEALNNAIRHSRANTVSIKFRAEKEFMDVQIRDDGIGFKTGFVRRGAGLKNIQNRIYLINGSHNIESAPGSGCTIQIQFPIIK